MRYTLALLVLSCGLRAASSGPFPVEFEGRFASATGNFDAPGFARLHATVPLWDSWQGEDKFIGRLKYGPFQLGDEFSVYVAGYPGEHGEVFGWEDPVTGFRQILAPRQVPTEHWTLLRWTVPPDWRKRNVYLFAEDEIAGGNGWLGVSAPVPTGFRPAPVLSLLGLHAVVFVLVLLPGAAFTLWVARRRQLAPELALALCLAGSAVTAYVLFFAYFAQTRSGHWIAVTVLGASLGMTILGWRRAAGTVCWSQLLRPLLFCFAIGVLYSAVLFLYGGIENPPFVSMERYLFRLPPDGVLPFWLGDRLANGQSPHGFFGDWLSSDRPPLQAAFYLLIHPVAPSTLGYQIMGTILQTWVFLGMWILLRLARVPARIIAWILFFAAFSGFFLLNGTLIWPKLLPAAFLLITAALLFLAPGQNGALAGACAGLAMLGHGGSAFGLIGLGLVSMFRPPPQRWRCWGATVLAGAVCLLPWSLYQKLADPPGNRLLKWHLAGVVDVDARSLPQALRDSYGALTVHDFLQSKWGNFTRLFGLDDSGLVVDFQDAARKISAGDFSAGLRVVGNAFRAGCFLNFFQSPGPLLVGGCGLALLARRRPQEAGLSRLAGLMLALIGATTVTWCLLMFVAKTSVNHQGSYFNNACLFILLGLGACQLPIRWLRALAEFTLLWFAVVWVVAPAHAHYTSALLPAADPGMLVFVVLTVPATAWTLIWLGRAGPTEKTGPHNLVG